MRVFYITVLLLMAAFIVTSLRLLLKEPEPVKAQMRWPVTSTHGRDFVMITNTDGKAWPLYIREHKKVFGYWINTNWLTYESPNHWIISGQQP